VPSARGGATGRSRRMSPLEKKGHAALDSVGALAQVMREGFVATSVTEKTKADAAAEVVRIQEAAAECRAAETNARVDRQHELAEKRQQAELLVAERKVALEEKRAEADAMMARMAHEGKQEQQRNMLLSDQLRPLSQMHQANPSKETLDAFLNLGSRMERTLGASTGGGTPMHGSQSCACGGADADDGAQGVARATGRGDP